jgi:YqjK-like protein
MIMNTKLIELAERRAALIARADAQRKELSQALAPWRGPLSIMERGAEAIRSVKKHPELLAGLAVFAAVLRPWRLVRWLPPGWAIWRIARLALGAKKLLTVL